jgi:hypothetical protein
MAAESPLQGEQGEQEAPRPSYEISLFANAVYYPNWRVYTKQPPSSLKLGFVSHAFYAFAWYVQYKAFPVAMVLTGPVEKAIWLTGSCPRVKADGTVYVRLPFV